MMRVATVAGATAEATVAITGRARGGDGDV